MKKIIAYLISTALLLTLFASCDVVTGEKSNENDIAGTWSAEVALPEQMTAAIDTALNNINPELSKYIDLSELKIDIILEFNDDGTYSSSIDKASLEALVKTVAKKVSTGFNEFTQNTIESLEIDIDESTVVTISEDSIIALFDDEFINSVVETSKQSGFYKAENGKLYTAVTKDGFDDEKFEEYEMADDTLSFIGSDGMGEDASSAMEGIYPLTYEKVK